MFWKGYPVKGFNFTERVRKVLAFAREEADSLQHEYVGTEHILLGLIREAELVNGGGVGAAVLRNLGVDVTVPRRLILEIVQRGKGAPATRDLPYTSRAKKVLELSM